MGCIPSKHSVGSPSQTYQTHSPDPHRASTFAQTWHYGKLPGPSSHNPLSTREKQLVGVARWPDSRFNNEDTPAQQKYGLSFWTASRKAGSDIAKGKLNSFDALWSQATKWRCQDLSDLKRSEFSQTRLEAMNFRYTGNPYLTPLSGRYDYIKDRYQNREADEIVDSCASFGEFASYYLEDNLNGKDINLSTVCISTKPDACASKPPFKNFGHVIFGSPFFIAHTNIERIPAIMEHVEGLSKKALNPSLSHADTLNVLADIHWWVANAMPDERGSAAKTEFAVRAIAHAKGMELGPLAHGMIADLEAMTTPREAFIDRYHSMFERSIH